MPLLKSSAGKEELEAVGFFGRLMRFKHPQVEALRKSIYLNKDSRKSVKTQSQSPGRSTVGFLCKKWQRTDSSEGSFFELAG